MRRNYREDIDWLRAMAVLPVVLFHYLEPPANFGGFVGVDIFFVISGYLITGIIQQEMKDGSFSLTRFYERRVRRLLPALYVMVALTAIPSFYYLLASERAEFFRSVVAVVTFTSNFFFWLQSGYFDHAAVEKPLLHTWSLAVEEQFYLVLPPFVWALIVMGARQPCRAGGRPDRVVARLIWIGRLADAKRGFRECVLHKSAARLGIPDRQPAGDRGFSGAEERMGATGRARGRPCGAGDTDHVPASGSGLPRHQCGFALHRARRSISGAESACRRR